VAQRSASSAGAAKRGRPDAGARPIEEESAMWQEYAVRVQTDAVVDLVHDDVIDTLIETLRPQHASLGQDVEGRFSARMTVPGDSMEAAARDAVGAVQAALALVGSPIDDGGIAAVDVSTEAEFERELNTPPPPSGAAFAALKEMRAGSPGDFVTVDSVWDALTDAGVVAQRPGRVG
jgi:hypothetical protein